MSSSLNNDASSVDESRGTAKSSFRQITAAWRFTMLRLLVFSTVTSAALAFAKFNPQTAVIPGLLWLVASLLCLRAGDTRDTVKLIATAFGVLFLLFIFGAMLAG